MSRGFRLQINKEVVSSVKDSSHVTVIPLAWGFVLSWFSSLICSSATHVHWLKVALRLIVVRRPVKHYRYIAGQTTRHTDSNKHSAGQATRYTDSTIP